MRLDDIIQGIGKIRKEIHVLNSGSNPKVRGYGDEKLEDSAGGPIK